MKRLVLSLVTGALAALVLVAPASAQYGGDPDAPPSGCPVEDPPPEDPPPCHPRTDAGVSDPDVQPGDSVTVTAPPVFAPGSEVTVNLVRARNGSNANGLGTGTAGSDGAVSESVTIPDVPSGVYFLYITGEDADGNLVVAMVAIVVRPAASTAAVGGDDFQAAAAAPVPAAVAEVQAVSPETEAAVVEAVTEGGAGLVLSPQGELSVRSAAGALQEASTLPTTGGDGIAEQVTVGAALVLAGTGFVLLRRRRGGFAK